LHETAEDVLISVIAEVTGLAEDEVRQSATPDAELDEAFSIDSITSLRLGKHLERRGYKFSMESFMGANFGSLVEQMKKNPLQLSRETTSDEDECAKELKDKDLPISENLMKQVGGGHDVAIGGIVPSLWYGLVGALVLKKNVKAVLHRMSLLDTKAKVMKETQGGRATLTFLTASDGKEPLIRAQVTSTNITFDKVPFITGKEPIGSVDGVDNIRRMMGQSGFSYKGPYQSLRRIELFRLDNQPEANNFASCYQVQAEAQVDLPEDPELAMVQAYFVAVDASFQGLFAGFGTMLAPAAFHLEVFESIEDWPHLLRQNGGKISIVCRYLKATATVVEGITTAYCGNRAVCNGRCTAKAIPTAIGSRCYPEFFFTPPRHVLLCFPGVAGTSNDYDTLADMMAPHGVRVFSVEFPFQGRRLMQTDDEAFSTLAGLKKDLMPWLHQMLRAPDGRTTPYSIVATVSTNSTILSLGSYASAF
jgi:acyl carrier protein